MIFPHRSRSSTSRRTSLPSAARSRLIAPARWALVSALVAGFNLVLASGSADTSVIVPAKTISLFNGTDLSLFYTWLVPHGHRDPDRVFTVVENIDGAPAIRISGQHFGGLTTFRNYANYRLVAEFRWGALTWSPRKQLARDSGILLHGQGEDGNGFGRERFQSPWIRSVEYQIIEGGTGDIILVGGYERGSDAVIRPRLTCPVLPGTRIWSANGVPTEFSQGRIDWEHRDPKRENVFGVRGPKDVEKPVGEWNRIEIVCREGDLDYYLNGRLVNGGRNGSFKSGKILVQSEGAEIFFRRIELQPLNATPSRKRP